MLYYVIITARNWFFDIGIFKKIKVSVPVISVGNISVGGSGKTPTVEMLVENMRGSRKIAVVSRGYKRKSIGTLEVSDGKGNLATVEQAGDEPMQIASKYPGVIVIVDEDKVRGAQKAVALGAEVVIVDDGFQHRRLNRDLDIVVLPVTDVLKMDWLLPAGNRRETFSAIKRADIVLLSRCENEQIYMKAAENLKKFGKQIVQTKIELKAFRQAKTNHCVDSNVMIGKNVVAFSGIGNPKSFDDVIISAKMNLKKHLIFPDHHWYSGNDIKRVIDAKDIYSADYIVTTEKDFVRLQNGYNNDFIQREDLFMIEISQKIIKGEEVVNNALSELFKEKQINK